MINLLLCGNNKFLSKYNSLSGIFGTKSARSLSNVYGVQYAFSFAQFNKGEQIIK